jgi:hypothetical protein
MSEVIIALLRTECGDEGADPAREARNSSLGCFSEMRFQFAERLLDWIEVRRIFGEVTQSRTGRFNQFSHTGTGMPVCYLMWSVPASSFLDDVST